MSCWAWLSALSKNVRTNLPLRAVCFDSGPPFPYPASPEPAHLLVSPSAPSQAAEAPRDRGSCKGPGIASVPNTCCYPHSLAPPGVDFSCPWFPLRQPLFSYPSPILESQPHQHLPIWDFFLGVWNLGVRKFTINERRMLLGGMWLLRNK